MRRLDDDGGQLDAEFDIEVCRRGRTTSCCEPEAAREDSMRNPDYFAGA